MPRTSIRPLGLLILVAALPATESAAAGDAKGNDWVLMGRHGGCAELAELAKRKPAFAGVATPQEFAAKARRDGHAAQVSEIDLGGSKGVIVDVKDMGLHVLFVRRSICGRIKTR